MDSKYLFESMQLMEEFNDEEIEIPVAKISWWEGRPETLIIIKFIDDDETWYEYDGSRTGLGGDNEFPSMDEAIKGFIDDYASEIKDLKFRHGYEQYDSLLDSTRGVVYGG